MGKMMVICVFFSALLPLTTTDVSTVTLPGDQRITQQPTEAPQEATSDITNQVHTAKTTLPTAKPMENVNSTATTRNPTTAHLEATTIYAAKAVQTSPMATSSEDLATSMARKAEMSTPAHDSTSSAPSSTSSGFPSNAMSTERAKVVVPTDTPTTRVVPTAKLSATTQFVSSVQTTTAKPATTSMFTPTTSQVTPTAQNTTTRKIPPAVVTKSHETATKGMKEDAKKSVKHGKIVAGLIGGALVMMMIGFLVILYKKHKLKKHQIATTDWAGPTPFLETAGDGRDNGHVTLRSANRISLASFLPQRLSKRMSLLAEEEEMQDMQEMTAGTTFGAKEEKNGTGGNQSVETLATEANENNSESSGKTEEMVLVDETKESKGKTGKEEANGDATMKDEENGQLNIAATQPAQKEDAPNETKDETKEATEKDGDNVA